MDQTYAACYCHDRYDRRELTEEDRRNIKKHEEELKQELRRIKEQERLDKIQKEIELLQANPDYLDLLREQFLEMNQVIADHPSDYPKRQAVWRSHMDARQEFVKSRKPPLPVWISSECEYLYH